MKRSAILTLATLALLAMGLADAASAAGRLRRGAATSGGTQWHGNYYHSAWGMPVALVVPPTAEKQTHWGWGVGGLRVTPICPQFEPGYPPPGYYDRTRFLPTPAWPSDTDQFGVYYVRGPW